jgi:membrane protein
MTDYPRRKTSMKNLQEILNSAYQRGNELSGGTLDILKAAVQSFNEANVSQAAASLAYYAMFSLFPLLLALVSIGGLILKGENVSQKMVTSVTRFIPVSENLIRSNIEQVLARRGTIGVIGLIGLLWSGMGVFTVLTQQINRAWTDAEPRGFLQNRLVALGLVGVLAVLLLLPFLTTPILGVLGQLDLPSWDKATFYKAFPWRLLSSGLPMLLTFLMFLGLYHWVPNTEVRWSDALWGAIFVTLAWEGAKRGFTWYVGSSLVNYPLVYGSLSTVIALLFWIYISSWLALFGAHLSAAVASKRSNRADQA